MRVFYYSTPEHEGSSFVSTDAEKIVDKYFATLRDIKFDPALTEEQRNQKIADAFGQFAEMIEPKLETGEFTEFHLDNALLRHTNDDGSFEV
jgi:hypothetical protein